MSLRALEQLFPGQRAVLRFRLSGGSPPALFAHLHYSTWRRNLFKRLIFLGDRLAEQRHDALALNMYHQAHAIEREMLLSTDPNSGFINLLSGMGMLEVISSHLVEFWSARGDAVKATAVESWGSCLTRATSQVTGRGFPGPGADPMGADDGGYIAVARARMLGLGLALLGVGAAVDRKSVV